MQTHHLITNPKRGTWGKGKTVSQAIERCAFTSSQDKVHVYLTDQDAKVNAAGGVMGRFVAYLGEGKVRSDKLRITLNLTDGVAYVGAADVKLIDLIHETLDGTEWSSDTLEVIADLLRGHGYEIREPV